MSRTPEQPIGWWVISDQLDLLSKQIGTDQGAKKRSQETKEFLKPIWNAELCAESQKAVLDRLRNASLAISNRMNQWRGEDAAATHKRSKRAKSNLSIPAVIVGLIPSSYDMIKTIRATQTTTTIWSIKIPRFVFDRSTKELVEAAGGAKSAASWKIDVEASEFYQNWDNCQGEVQLKVLAYTYERIKERREEGKREGKRRVLSHLYPNLAHYQELAGLTVQTESLTREEADTKQLLTKLRNLFGNQDAVRQRFTELDSILTSIWSISLRNGSDEALQYTIKSASDTIQKARSGDSVSESARKWRHYLDLVPTAYDLIKTAQFYQPQWTIGINLVVFDGALSEAIVAGGRTPASRSWLAAIKASPVYINWNNLVPSVQLAILDYTYLGISSLRRWIAEQPKSLVGGWRQHMLLPKYYLELAKLDETLLIPQASHADTPPPREKVGNRHCDPQHAWTPLQRKAGDSVHVLGYNRESREDSTHPQQMAGSRKRHLSSPSSSSSQSRRSQPVRHSSQAHSFCTSSMSSALAPSDFHRAIAFNDGSLQSTPPPQQYLGPSLQHSLTGVHTSSAPYSEPLLPEGYASIYRAHYSTGFGHFENSDRLPLVPVSCPPEAYLGHSHLGPTQLNNTLPRTSFHEPFPSSTADSRRRFNFLPDSYKP